MKTVALLPIKGNSQRVPGKNFRSFNGKPLFRWILDTLLTLDDVAQVVINTDAEAILRQHGLPKDPRILLRPRRPEICGDFVSMNRVIEDDVRDVPADIYLMTHATNPLLPAATIRAALQAYKDGLAAGRCDSLFTVNKVQTRFYRADASPVNHDPRNLVRTQDLEPWYEENSNLYLFTAASFTAAAARIGLRPMLHELRHSEAVDIDDQWGWDLAEMIARSGYLAR
jgi:CMP-N-acetylneuraminic acid synthetase